jgi:hypothetical protein
MISIVDKLRELLLLSLMLLLSTLVGCSGCQQDDTEKLTKEELEKKLREERESLVAQNLVSLPTDSQRALVNVKPGHWHETTQRFKSNREDLQVMLVGGVYYGTEKANLPSTNFINEYSRRTTLPKGQEKTIALQIYVPPTNKRQNNASMDVSLTNQQSTACRVGTELRALPLMSPIPNSDQRTTANELKPYTFQLAVLSPQPLVYQYLANLDTIRWGASDLDFDNERILSYDVSLVGPKDNQYAFPHSLLTMTAMAVLVWDDVSVNDLSEDQQNAILDWVHWGGQLIISGPTSWARLQGSFLSPYIPSSAESVALKTEDFAEMAKTWKTRDISKGAIDRDIEIGDEPVSGLKFQLSPQSSWLPGSGELVAESSVGRGRIVVTGFSLREPKIRDSWPYFSSFVSTGLLRRLPREVEITRADFTQQKQVWSAPFKQSETQPQFHSNIRLLSRDLLSSVATVEESVNSNSSASNSIASTSRFSNPNVNPPKVTQPPMPAESVATPPKAPLSDLANEVAYEPQAWGGAGGWSDFSGVATEAISALRAAAGIELPSRETILKLLGGYLICLVPLNWFVFRVFRRLEYAWLAAPIMAIVGVVVVGKVARLDIGFARRTTEISVLETYGGYPRAHLTQYVALYTSLSTNYSVEFPENDSVALPMGDVQREFRRAQVTTRNLQTSYGRADGVVLEPMTVYSNSTEMLHSEQMINLDSPIRLNDEADGSQSIVNTTKFPVRGATLLRRVESGIETAWLDTLAAGQSVPIQWKATESKDVFEKWSDSVNTQRSEPSEGQLSTMDDIWIGGLLHQIGLKTPLMSGQARLIGYTDQSLGQLKIAPSQDQYDQACIVVAHLSPAKLRPIVPDRIIASRGFTQEPAPASTPESDPAKPGN